MATINNSANITYRYGTSTEYALSNVASTELKETYSILAQKTSYNTSWRPSENLTYSIEVTNSGVDALYGVSVQDNLGGETNRLLTYIPGSAKMLKNGSLVGVTPTNTEPLTMVIPDALKAGETVIFTYVAKVRNDIDATINEITNEVTVVGHETSISGPTITVNPNPSVTIPKASYAEVRIDKFVDKEDITAGDTLTYTFRLENSGNTEATNVVIVDDLPEKFVITSINSETNGIVTAFETTDYSIDETNKLTLPTSATKTILVPARTTSGDGITTVTIVGQITA